MKALIQRVSKASVSVDNAIVGSINQGILLFLGIEADDDDQRADKLLRKVINYRIFSDSDSRMNLSLTDINGELLIVSQFTLVAETSKGLRPGFSRGASPEQGQEIYKRFIDKARLSNLHVQTGEYGANMQVSLINDGPVTFWLES